MIVNVILNNSKKSANLDKPIDLSLCSKTKNSFKAWYVEEIKANVIKNDDFIGSVEDGGSVNFKELLINPHGNMTHTESVGHISKENVFVNNLLPSFHFTAQLLTIKPEKATSDGGSGVKKGDYLVDLKHIENKINPNVNALIIKTQQDYSSLHEKTYNNTNWPYITENAAGYIRDSRILHLLIDQPSVDKEFDDGKLLAHKAFWNYPNIIDSKRTITELIGIPDGVPDGFYLLNLSLSNIENDASPSRPVIYKLY